jgi:uroporphyrinogen-III synthase
MRSLKARICAIGPATKAAVEALHLKVDLMPEEYVAESLVQAFAKEDLQFRRILLPRAAVARDLVPRELSRRGAQVDVIEAYQTVAPSGLGERVRLVLDKKPHWLTFTSSSTVINFIAAMGREGLDGIKIASIGPITSATLREHGVEPTVEAQPHTIGGLVDAISAAATRLRA